ncbi:hypothetical protein G4L39_03800, partial [Limisphaera ngatamarikiensis]|nr:hypothetical protein [Limisphaera ngatamarikiensis]
VDELVAEIAAASQEQSQGIGQINSAVSQMDKVTQANAAAAEQSAAAAQELTAQAASLRQAVQTLVQLVGYHNGQGRTTGAPQTDFRSASHRASTSLAHGHGIGVRDRAAHARPEPAGVGHEA